MKRIHKKKTLAVVALSFCALLIGGVIAFSKDISFLRSLFGLGYYSTVHIEEFTSPQDWKTCDITPKTVVTRNESNFNIAVRISYEEFWKASDGTTDLPLVKDGVTLANIHFQNQSDWELTDGYYYYKYDLAPGQSTNSLFEAVQLSCDANLSPEDNICTDTATGKECVQPQNSYSEATYHLVVKIETIQVEGKGEWLPDEEGTIYGEIQKEAEENGTDEDIDFDAIATENDGNGNGVNIRKGTEDDRFPIMYYRGQVDTNNVIWGDSCWKILRTTETGGTKIFYNGIANNGQCSNTPAGSEVDNDIYERPVAGADFRLYAYPFNDINREGVDDYNSPMGYGGYMFDDLQFPYDWRRDYLFNLGSSVYVSRGIEYGEDRKYHLINPQHITVSREGDSGDDWDIDNNLKGLIADGYYYACLPMTTDQCEHAIYSVSEPYLSEYGGFMYYFEMVDGDLLPDVRRKVVGSNQFDSVAKIAVEAWYEENVLGKSFESDLEDTVFCNDRSLTDWALKGEQYPLITSFFEEDPMFQAPVRLFNTSSPTYYCANSDDRFTANPANGNGKLNYPVGLMSGDEMKIAGVFPEGTGGRNLNNYPFGLVSWGFSMTPLYMIGMGSAGNGMGIYVGDMTYETRQGVIEDWRLLRPTVSLKHGTKFVEGGEGTLENPYVVEH